MVCRCKLAQALDIITIKLASKSLDTLDFMQIAQLDEETTVFTTDREDSFDEPSTVINKVVWFEDQKMKINIKGKLYFFCNVPRRIFESFKGAASKGAFFVRNIKGQFNC